MKKISFNDLFMSMVYLVSMKSKDESTHIGAVIVDNDNIIVSVGYNGLPRGCNDNLPYRQKRPEKYFWFEHAERNAIYNARRSLKGCTLYTQGIPCADCARAVIQSGIKKVVVHGPWYATNAEQWNESCLRSEKMFKETGVEVEYYQGEILKIIPWRNGKVAEI